MPRRLNYRVLLWTIVGGAAGLLYSRLSAASGST